MTRLTEIEERAKNATEGPWKKGYTILTPQTKRWSKKQMEMNDRVEWMRVFANFSEEDQGRSRRHIADCSHDHEYQANVDFIAHSREDIPYLLSLLRSAEEALDRLSKMPLKAGSIKTYREMASTALSKIREEKGTK